MASFRAGKALAMRGRPSCSSMAVSRSSTDVGRLDRDRVVAQDVKVAVGRDIHRGVGIDTIGIGSNRTEHTRILHHHVLAIKDGKHSAGCVARDNVLDKDMLAAIRMNDLETPLRRASGLNRAAAEDCHVLATMNLDHGILIAAVADDGSSRRLASQRLQTGRVETQAAHPSAAPPSSISGDSRLETPPEWHVRSVQRLLRVRGRSSLPVCNCPG